MTASTTTKPAVTFSGLALLDLAATDECAPVHGSVAWDEHRDSRGQRDKRRPELTSEAGLTDREILLGPA